jgi:CheY-like chemotaxis protein
MMTNSVKYGALCDSSGSVTITLSQDDHKDLCIEWRERGGPPVRAPERRGFGSTIIERSIPYELKGDAEIRYKLSGVEAEFMIPGRYVQPGKPRTGKTAEESRVPHTMERSTGSIPGHVLVVEDNMIIAMDTEDSLRSLGVNTVTTAGSVASALESISKDQPEFAVLDYNLGNESSDAVAAKLKAIGVPFVLATGYGELADKLEEHGAMGLLKKPYGKAELSELLEKIART